MKIPIFQVDAFTSKLFAGNPAAVCPLEKWLDETTMQNIGAENNLSETAFFVARDDLFDLRWFTPTAEVNLCGHATLASGHVLFDHLGYKSDEIKFMSKSGELAVTRKKDLISLDFPSSMPKPITMPKGLVEALGLEPREILQARDLFAVYESPEEIKNMKPRFDLLATVEAYGIIITAPGRDCDFVSRFFAPRLGINEDPVTGSAHTTLIPYWSKSLGKKQLLAHQVSKRGGELICENLGDRVLISGKAVTYLVGEIEV